SEEAIQDLQGRSRMLQREAVGLEKSADQKEDEAEIAMLDAKQREAEKFAVQQERVREERESRIENWVAERDQLAQEVAQSKIVEREPSIGAIIGAVLGGFLLPTLGKNPALDIIERRIERDLKRQEANLRHKRSMLGMMDT